MGEVPVGAVVYRLDTGDVLGRGFNRREIDRLQGKLRQKGYTMVPLSLYQKNGHVKVELALVHGKQEWDRREDVKKREADREIARAMSRRR